LALEATRAVARAIAIVPSFSPIDQADNPNPAPDALHRDGQVLVVIVPSVPELGRSPSNDLLADVEDYLRARCAPGASVQVIGPSGIAADIAVPGVASSLDATDAVLAQTRAAVARLLDPVVGGAGDGWPFSRRPRVSDVAACIRAVPGVEHLTFLDVQCEAP